MSDLGLLSHQYQTKSEFSRRLRLSVLRIKRRYYSLPLSEGENEDDVRASITEILIIVEFLQDVISLNEDDVWSTKWLENPALPITLVDRLKNTHALDHPSYIKSLKRIAENLQRDLTNLRSKDILLLEEIAHLANADANTVFRKLMRWG